MFEELLTNTMIIIESLYQFCKDVTVTEDNLDTKAELSSLVVVFLRHLSLLCMYKEFFETFSKVKSHLIIHVLFPFLITTKRERENMIEDPSEFVSYANDICYRQVNFKASH
jgi:hypothetical protein